MCDTLFDTSMSLEEHKEEYCHWTSDEDDYDDDDEEGIGMLCHIIGCERNESLKNYPFHTIKEKPYNCSICFHIIAVQQSLRNMTLMMMRGKTRKVMTKTTTNTK